MKPGALRRYQGLRTFAPLKSYATLERYTEIRKQSPKKRRELRVWRRVTLKLVDTADGECQALTPVCTYFATTGHHKQRRAHLGPSIESNCLVCCQACHDFIHANPQWAREHDLLLSAHNPERPS